MRRSSELHATISATIHGRTKHLVKIYDGVKEFIPWIGEACTMGQSRLMLWRYNMF